MEASVYHACAQVNIPPPMVDKLTLRMIGYAIGADLYRPGETPAWADEEGQSVDEVLAFSARMGGT